MVLRLTILKVSANMANKKKLLLGFLQNVFATKVVKITFHQLLQKDWIFLHKQIFVYLKILQ